MAVRFDSNLITAIETSIKNTINSAKYAVLLNDETTWVNASSLTKTTGDDYVQVDMQLDHSSIGTGTVTEVRLYDSSSNVLAKIATSIYRPSATDDVFFRVKIKIKAELAE